MEEEIDIEIVEVKNLRDESDRLRHEEESAKLLSEGADFTEVAVTSDAERVVPNMNLILRGLYDHIKEDGLYIYEMHGHTIFVTKDAKRRRIGGATRKDCVSQFGEAQVLEWEKKIQ